MKTGDLRGAFVVTAPVAALAENASANSIALLLIDIGMVLGAMVVVFVVLRRFVVRPVTQSAVLAKEIAENNLAVTDIEVTSGDEVGEALTALNTMKNNVRRIVESIASTAEHVASASHEISRSASEQAAAAGNQTDRTTQVATATQEMSSTVTLVSENAQKAAQAASKATATAHGGGQIVEEAVRNMRAIAESVSGTAAKIRELGKSSDQIGEIVAVIEEIADQTNLLALNAAIEAARAGEQGRGFAVVADEVRKLAERTGSATKEIAKRIQNIQVETNMVVKAMESGTRQVEEGVSATGLAGDSLKEIIQMNDEVGQMIAQIATASTEQSAATEEVASNISEIARLARESADGARESVKACDDLSSLAFDLEKIVGQFKLAGNGGKQRHSPDSRHTTPPQHLSGHHQDPRLEAGSMADGSSWSMTKAPIDTKAKGASAR
jgi:methyl-accepting chemotaxis protein